MATPLRTYATPAAAHVAVERIHDHRDDPVRNFAGRPVRRVGTFAGPPHVLREGRGTFAGDPACQRWGGFDDVDRKTFT